MRDRLDVAALVELGEGGVHGGAVQFRDGPGDAAEVADQGGDVGEGARWALLARAGEAETAGFGLADRLGEVPTLRLGPEIEQRPDGSGLVRPHLLGDESAAWLDDSPYLGRVEGLV